MYVSIAGFGLIPVHDHLQVVPVREQLVSLLVLGSDQDPHGKLAIAM